MFDVLLVSAVKRRVSPGRAGLALGVHGLVLFGAVRGTAAKPEAAPERHSQLVVFEQPPPVVERAAPAPAGGAIVAAPRGDFSAAPSDLPLTIPPVLAGVRFDPTMLRPPESGQQPGWVAGDSGVVARLMDAASVDQPAAIIRQPSPRYPPVLQQAGIAGRVLLEFIIDSTGHPEAGSLRVLERSGPGFDAAALETIERSLFRPAQFRGRAVRQRTLQAIVFRVRE